MPEDKNSTSPNPDAEFLGWQKSLAGAVIALYNIIAPRHPLYGSTVTKETLRKQNLEIPDTPVQEE